MIKLALFFVFVAIVYIQSIPTHSFIDSRISDDSSLFTAVDNKIDLQHKEQDELKTQRVHSTIRPNDMSIYYKWLAFLKSSTSTTAYDLTNQSKIT